MVKAKWLASLNDGTTAIENEGDFIAGPEGSPWTKLEKYVEEKGLHITGLRVQVERDGEAVRTYVMPSLGNVNKDGCHVRWRFMRPLPVDSYLAVRGACASMGTGGQQARDMYIRCIAEYQDFVLSMVIDVAEGTEVSVVIHEKS